MSLLKKTVALTTLISIILNVFSQLDAVTYVTDTGGYAYDESRAVTNLAPAIALGTVAIVGIIAIAVNNAHDHSSSYSTHCSCSSSSSSCSSSSSYGYSSSSSSRGWSHRHRSYCSRMPSSSFSHFCFKR